MKPDVAKLRQTILQLAIEGKLVPQDPLDKPAHEQLKQIETEKRKLVAEGKLRKAQPLMPLADDEKPFEIPINWVWVRLGDISSRIGDGLHGTPKYSEDGEYYFINGNNLTDKQIEIKGNTKKVSTSEFAKYKKALSGNTLLLSINGTLGNTSFYNNEKVVLGKSAAYINLLEGVSKHYLLGFLKTNYSIEYYYAKATGTTIKNVPLSALNKFPVPLPPLQEQKRIAAKVDELMALCDELEGKSDNFLDALAKLRQTVLQLALEGKLVPQDLSEGTADDFIKQIEHTKQKLLAEGKIRKSKPLTSVTDAEKRFNVPNTWVWVHGQEVIELIRGVSYDKSEVKTEPTDGYVGLLRAGNVSQKGILDFDNLLYVPKKYVGDSQLIRKDDIMLVMSSGSKSHVGKAARSLEDTSYTFGTFNALVRPILVAPRYMGYYFLSQLYRQQIEEFGSGVNIINLNKGKIDQLVLPLPPLGEQKRIVAKVDELMTLCDELESKLSLGI